MVISTAQYPNELNSNLDIYNYFNQRVPSMVNVTAESVYLVEKYS